MSYLDLSLVDDLDAGGALAPAVAQMFQVRSKLAVLGLQETNLNEVAYFYSSINDWHQ